MRGDSNISPQRVGRQGGSGCTVRVAVEGSECCLYRTISITETDRARSVVMKAMKKHGIEGDPGHYHLKLLNHHNESELLPYFCHCMYVYPIISYPGSFSL